MSKAIINRAAFREMVKAKRAEAGRNGRLIIRPDFFFALDAAFEDRIRRLVTSGSRNVLDASDAHYFFRRPASGV